MLADVVMSVSSPVLVGRSGQLSTLRDALAEAGRGCPVTMLVGGEAGVGKSRLLTDFAARARRDGTRVLAGGCLELGADGLPFAPFTAVLRELVRDLGAAGIAGLLPAGTTRELARLLPEFGEPAAAEDAGEARARLFEQILILLEQLAGTSPVLLVIEDAHWADQSTRDLLAFLIRNQQALDGLLLVVTYRSDELHRTHPLRPLLAELDRISWVRRMELGRLSRRNTDQLAARLLGHQPAPDVLEAVYRRTEGNPLFVEALLGEGELVPGLPESLRDLLVASVRRLPEETQDVVRVASAAGERTGHALLAAVTGLDLAGLARALRPAVAANVLLTDEDGFVFRHALIREAMSEELLPGESTQLHSHFAEAISADPALVPPGRAAVEQAHHWYAAHDTAWALVSASAAAAESGHALAYAEQLAMLSRVLELWDQVPGAGQRIGSSRLAVLEAAVRAAELAGEFDRGIALAKAALREVDIDAEPVRAALLFEARGHLTYLLGRTGFTDDLREAARLVPADPPTPARARVLEALAHDVHHRIHWDDADFLAGAEEAVTVARQAGDPATEAAALVTLACARPPGQDLPGIRALLAEARAVAARAKAYQPLLRAVITESDLLEGLGQHEQAAEVARDGIRTAAEYGLARTSGVTLAVNLAEPLVSLGRWDEAAEVIERTDQLLPPTLLRSSLWRLSGDIAVARGELAAAAESVAAIRAALCGTRYKDEHQLALARLETELDTAQDRPAQALAVAGDALDHFDVRRSARYGWPLLAAAARACAAADRDPALAARAAALRSRLRSVAGQLPVTGLAQPAHQLTFAAEMMTGPGHPDGGARAAWDAATVAWEAAGQPYPRAVALLAAAGAALAAGDRDGGAARLRRAATLARDLGAQPLSGQIAVLARRARVPLGGGTGPGDGPAPVTGPDRLGLTARELEVLRLVAAGQSNRDIASKLFISAKTASVHVSNILRKLGVTSRGEAAATAHRLRLFDSFPAASEEPSAPAARGR
ncbi:MAG TPA: AAA family ATPase [Streptosporangiaceae bacterium]|nr:AAA family ATPase [Streptosporangiaceae bacterium]